MQGIIRELVLPSRTGVIILWQGDREGAFSLGWDHGGAISGACAANGYVYSCRYISVLTTSVSAAVANWASARR